MYLKLSVSLVASGRGLGSSYEKEDFRRIAERTDGHPYRGVSVSVRSSAFCSNGHCTAMSADMSVSVRVKLESTPLAIEGGRDSPAVTLLADHLMIRERGDQSAARRLKFSLSRPFS